MSTQAAKPPTAKLSTAPKKMKTNIVVKEKTSATRLTEADKALDTVNYILNPNTNKHVKRNSSVGEQLATGNVPAKTPTVNEILTNVVRSLQEAAPEALSNSTIKEIIKKVDGIPRTFPSEFGGKGKKPRPEGKPKGPKNAYIIFATEMRSQVQKNNPGVPNSAKEGNSITAIIGQLWGSLENKSEYETKAKKDTARYETEMAVWEAANPTLARKATGPKKQTRTTGYRIYCEDNRAKFKEDNKDVGGKEISAKLNAAWKSFTDEQKATFDERAVERNAALALPVSADKKRKAKKVKEPENIVDDDADLLE